ncbi:MAG: RecX family transcriptional regulator [Bacteroidota bacterium]|nr:RecX family transcriptional regulator [Bacteroidota bacterium]
MRRIQPIELPDVPPKGGKVTAVQVQKKDPDRCSVFLNGSFAFGLHMNIVAEAGLRKGMQLDEAACRKLLEEDVYFKAYKRCLDYLAYRPRTGSEIRIRLRDLAVPEDIAGRIYARLADLGYLDDERFARQFAASRLRSKGFGPRRLEAELRRKGIDASTARAAIEEVCSPDDVESQLKEQLEKAQKKYRKEADGPTKTRKIMAFLARRGFSPGAIREALDR